uniref:Far upstream element-binding protein C-terminal domain-containing protein n=1 Tax=Timema poppense TaxID=170557 RepID=A0A7R9H1P1_TIMPO|nr:unnamed protein product [Timema poppensis]
MVIIGCSLLARAADLPRSTPLVAKAPLEDKGRLNTLPLKVGGEATNLGRTNPDIQTIPMPKVVAEEDRYRQRLANREWLPNSNSQAQPAPQPQPQPQAQPAAAAAAAAQNGQPDYSAQWAEYYRSIGKIKEAEAIEAQMKANKGGGQPGGGPGGPQQPQQQPGGGPQPGQGAPQQPQAAPYGQPYGYQAAPGYGYGAPGPQPPQQGQQPYNYPSYGGYGGQPGGPDNQ